MSYDLGCDAYICAFQQIGLCLMLNDVITYCSLLLRLYLRALIITRFQNSVIYGDYKM